MKKRYRCYNSGMVGGLSYLSACENFRLADQEIESMGFIPVNPLIRGLKPSYPWIMHMIVDIIILIGCDHIYMQRNWESSRGARIEKKIAHFLEIKIWYQDNPCCDNPEQNQ